MIDWRRFDRQRLRVGKTNAEVARAAGISPATLSRARVGKTKLRESTFRRIALALSMLPVPRGADELLVPDPAAPPAETR